MADDQIEQIFERVPAAERDLYLRFSREHPYHEIDVDGLPLRYISTGSGDRTLLLLPGLLGDAKSMYRLALAFEDRYRILACSYLDSAEIERQVAAFARLLDTERVTRVTIIGQTLGGFLAQSFLKVHPERVEDLVIIHASVPERGYLPNTETLRRLLGVLPFALWKQIVKRILLNVVTRTRRSGAITAERAAMMRAYFEYRFRHLLTRRTARARYGLMHAMAAHSSLSAADLHSWHGRVMALYSPGAWFDPKYIEKFKQVYGEVRLCPLDRGGQLSLYLLPEVANAAIKDFLDAA